MYSNHLISTHLGIFDLCHNLNPWPYALWAPTRNSRHGRSNPHLHTQQLNTLKDPCNAFLATFQALHMFFMFCGNGHKKNFQGPCRNEKVIPCLNLKIQANARLLSLSRSKTRDCCPLPSLPKDNASWEQWEQQKTPLSGSFEATVVFPEKLLSTLLDGIVRLHRDNHANAVLTGRKLRLLKWPAHRCVVVCYWAYFS